MNISLSAFAPENLVSRDGFGSPVPRQPAHLHTQAKSGAYLWDSSRHSQHVLFSGSFRYSCFPRRCSSTPSTAIDRVTLTSLSGHAFAYQWHSLRISNHTYIPRLIRTLLKMLTIHCRESARKGSVRSYSILQFFTVTGFFTHDFKNRLVDQMFLPNDAVIVSNHRRK